MARPRSRPFPIMLPHEMFSCLYQEYPDRSNVESYTGALLKRRHRTKGPAHQVPRDVRAQRLGAMCSAPVCSRRRSAMPLHRKAGTTSFVVFNMQGVLSTGSSKTVKLFVYGMFEHNKVNDDDATVRAVWQIISWSLRTLYDGVLAFFGPHGRQSSGSAHQSTPRQALPWRTDCSGRSGPSKATSRST